MTKVGLDYKCKFLDIFVIAQNPDHIMHSYEEKVQWDNILFVLSTFQGSKTLTIRGRPMGLGKSGFFDILKAISLNDRLLKSDVKRFELRDYWGAEMELEIDSGILMHFYAIFPKLEYIMVPFDLNTEDSDGNLSSLFSDFDFLLKLTACRELNVGLTPEFANFLVANCKMLTHIEKITLSLSWNAKHATDDFDVSCCKYFDSIIMHGDFINLRFKNLNCYSLSLNVLTFENAMFHFESLRSLQTIILYLDRTQAFMSDFDQVLEVPSMIKIEYPKEYVFNQGDLAENIRKDPTQKEFWIRSQEFMKTAVSQLQKKEDPLELDDVDFTSVAESLQNEIRHVSLLINLSMRYQANLKGLRIKFPAFPFEENIIASKTIKLVESEITVVEEYDPNTSMVPKSMIWLLDGFDGRLHHRIVIDFAELT